MRTFLLATATLLLVACSDDPLDPLRSIRIEVPSTVTFIAPGPTDVAFVVRNTGTRGIPLQHCGSDVVVHLDLWSSDGWQEITDVECATGLLFTEIAGGDEREGYFRLNFPGPARYRLRIVAEDGEVTSHAIELE